MTREIKFRAWDIENKQMIPVGKLLFFDDDTIHVGNRPTSYRGVQQLILMQYTGLKDKNGKEIYEGDVIKVPYYESPLSYGSSIEVGESVGVVDYSKQYLMYVIKVEGESSPEGLCNYDESDIEVIGNIHGNPSLQEATNDLED